MALVSHLLRVGIQTDWSSALHPQVKSLHSILFALGTISDCTNTQHISAMDVCSTCVAMLHYLLSAVILQLHIQVVYPSQIPKQCTGAEGLNKAKASKSR